MVFNNLTIAINRPKLHNKTQFDALVHKNGGVVARIADAIPDVVVSSEAANATTTSVFVYATKNNIPIVRELWIDDCISAGKLLDTADYAYPDTVPITLKVPIPSTSKSDGSDGESEEDEDLPVVVISPLAGHDLTPSQLNSFSEFANVRYRYSQDTDVVVATSLEYSKKKPVACIVNGKKNNVPIVSPLWVIESLKKEKVVDTGSYLLDFQTKTTIPTPTEKAPKRVSKSTSDSGEPPLKRARSLSPELLEITSLDIEAIPTERSIPKDFSSLLSPPHSPRAGLKKVGKISVPVDSGCFIPNVEVLIEDSTVWSVCLNQTDLSANANKFYIIQLLVNTNTNTYFVFTKWGRVGAKTPASATKPCNTLDSAKKEFMSKFKSKTGNEFSVVPFTPKAGKYTPIAIDYSAADSQEVVEQKKSVEEVEEVTDLETVASKNVRLPERLENFIAFIFNSEYYRNAQIEMNYNSDKLPLGKLSRDQVKMGFSVLSEIQAVLEGKSTQDLEDLSGRYYTYIPTNFGMKRPPIISSEAQIKTLLMNLSDLADMAIGEKLMALAQKLSSSHIHHTVLKYRQLQCGLFRVDPNDAVHSVLSKFITTNIGPTHNNYQLAVVDLFKIDRPEEKSRYDACPIGNKQLLFHGSRVTNAAGILSSGLRIAPPNVPTTGYMFGKGIYLANMSTKSANYCHPQRTEDGNMEGTLYLCEAKLGKTKQFHDAQYMEKPHTGSDCTWGVGRTTPDPNSHETFGDVLVPIGKASKSEFASTVLEYDEFIVYDVAQVLLKFVARVRFLNYR
ncbi:hypothetical protein RCL1_005846 [Eukaryota sp. TZLM3-RCL]